MEQETPRIRLVAGLGNPGAEYAHTRHNIGFMVVDLLAHERGLAWEKPGKWDAATAKFGDALLVKPASYMNRSGHPLIAIAQFFKIPPPEILVVLDDFSLPVGRLRIRQSGGPADTTVSNRSSSSSAAKKFRGFASELVLRRRKERAIMSSAIFSRNRNRS